MKSGWLAVRAGLLAAAWVGGVGGLGQSTPTASQALQISVFGGGTETYTELAGDRNTGLTAGLDITLRNYFHVRPGIEVRGTFPVSVGNYVGLKSALVGPVLSKDYGRFHPYVDGMFGRGSIDYENGGIIVGNYRYDRTTTNIFAGGGGVDVRVTRQFDVKADVQFQRWETPVTDTGYIYPVPVTVGVVYHLDFNKHPRRRRVKGQPTQ